MFFIASISITSLIGVVFVFSFCVFLFHGDLLMLILLQRFMLLQQPGAGGAAASKVICLTQVVSADELRDDEEYEDIMEDMKQEGEKFGIFSSLSMYFTFSSNKF